jgi:uncharacterized protein
MKAKLFATASALLLAASASAAARQNAAQPVITVTGQAEIRVVPDEVVFRLEAENVDKDVMTAKGKTDETVKQVLALARRHGVEPQNVQAGHISVGRRYEEVDHDKNDKTPDRSVFVGYEVSKTVVIRQRDLTRFEPLLSDILGAGVTAVRDVEFRTTQLRQHKDRARAMAIRAAQEKATALTREVGQTVGKAVSIVEQDPDSRGSNFAANNTMTVSGGYSAEEEESAFAPGMITVRARVQVSFRLE